MKKPTEEYAVIDPGLSPLFRFISDFTLLEGMIDGPEGLSMSVEKMTLSMPIDLDIVSNNDGTVTLGGSTPSMYAPVGLMPVFHHIRMTIHQDDNQYPSSMEDYLDANTHESGE